MEKANGRGFGRIVKATKCSMDGIGYAWTNEAAFRQEFALFLVLVPFAVWFANNMIELILLLIPLFLLLVVEVINSAIEATVDRISTSRHPLSKQAKDLGSAAVFFTLLLLGTTWSLVGLSRIY